ncbi:NADP(H)-dependent aldo-keto reductase [Bermanella marisrubri]|uniref:Protein tas n=1 Tax=Bermanella marisrubri TaxID=207949 RepID=Q1N6A2_9GAMM|nr:NADP(H)-dependent aldo-keto reductase [Bermanella marisrubri]EAT13690.1 Aldo/keto reductase [Oceanobacter sp. RED65] [Bermanella marisrubri]QIZ84469.1 NADP(H)-dependent aldo-keto reductase [Bermanella marisrubri]
MKHSKLGNTSIDVSRICLGTMTWGEQNTEAEAHEQMDYAVEQGINFFDAAEMYPVPPKPETQGLTEQYIGTWFAKHKKREDIIMATKVAGPGDWLSHIRGGSRLNRDHIMQAIDTSLERLQTDYVDVYQLHWPDRNTNFFGQLGFTPKQEEQSTDLEETLSALNELKQAGKIRHWGFSNETPWGVMKALQICDEKGFDRPVSIQNPYNLLNRSYEVGLAEISWREQIGLLAYSPLGFGVLTGKYLNDAPANARLTLWERFSRYTNDEATAATKLYAELAKDNGLTPTQLALAFVNQQGFLTANIIGATNMEQLKENIDSINIELKQEIIDEINAIHKRYSNPAP